MAELGNKHECFECGTKFYDLGKSQAICPKCSANQKHAGKAESAPERKVTRRKRVEKQPPPAPEESADSKPVADKKNGKEEDP